MLAVFFMESQIAGQQYHVCISNIAQSMTTSPWHPAIIERNAIHAPLIVKGHECVNGLLYIQYAHITIKHSLAI